MLLDEYFVTSDAEKKRLETTKALAELFATRAAQHDLEGSFPHENIQALKDAGYVQWTVPKKFGGEEISLREFIMHQEQLARGDGSTALAIGWHVGIILNLRASGAFPEPLFEKLCRAVMADNVLMNSCASEPATGSPSRGGRPETTAVRVDGGYRVTGRKTFSTLSPALDWVLITAGIADSDAIGDLIVKGTDIQVIETWNTLGMRASGSHDIVMEDVFVPDEFVVAIREPGDRGKRGNDGGGWMLHIPACYLGVGLAARDYAMEFAATYQPNSLPHPIANVPHVEQKLGEMELKLLSARTLLYDLAARWDSGSQKDWMKLRPYFGAAKTEATNAANEVVDLAMRVVGGRSLSRDLPLERYYRDIRAGLHNPPMDDIVFKMLAQSGTAPYRKG